MKRLLSIFFLSLLFSCQTATKTYSPDFVISENTLFDIPEDQEYTFGYLRVPENRKNPESRMIELPVYIFKSRSENPKPDPVIFTVGGPGNTTMRNAPYMKYYKYLDDRDLILFEQRGTTYAKPHLACPEWADAARKSSLPDFQDSADSLMAAAAITCRDRLTGEGVDLNGYNTREIAADLADLKITLELDQINLLTMSYSTKIALAMLRDYPDGIRSVVMDSPLPLEVSYDEESITNLVTKLNEILNDCSLDAECNSKYPDLKNRFWKYMQEITEDPLEITVSNPENGNDETFWLRGRDVILLFSDVSTSGVVEVPFQMEKLLNNDLQLVREMLQGLFSPPGTGDGRGMRLSVWCAEEHPFVSQENVEKQKREFPALRGLSPVVFEDTICRIWSVERMPAIDNEAVQSEIPVLLINGGYDNETPARWAEKMQEDLTNSYHIVFPGWKHGPITYWDNPCAMDVAVDFFNDPFTKPETPCLGELPPVSFK